MEYLVSLVKQHTLVEDRTSFHQEIVKRDARWRIETKDTILCLLSASEFTGSAFSVWCASDRRGNQRKRGRDIMRQMT